MINVYSDGACSGNPGRGGWAALINHGGKETTIKGGVPATTNNRMELTAAIEGLKATPEGCKVTLYSDSRYVVDGATRVYNWQAAGWRNTSGAVKNKDLWELMLIELGKRSVKFQWVKGHNGHRENEIVDIIAAGEAGRYS